MTQLETVYGLIDPRDFHTFYVGRSVHPAIRLRQHCRAKTPVGDYIRAMQSAGYEPLLEILATDLLPAHSPLYERVMIHKKAKAGGIFLNRLGKANYEHYLALFEQIYPY